MEKLLIFGHVVSFCTYYWLDTRHSGTKIKFVLPLISHSILILAPPVRSNQSRRLRLSIARMGHRHSRREKLNQTDACSRSKKENHCRTSAQPSMDLCKRAVSCSDFEFIFSNENDLLLLFIVKKPSNASKNSMLAEN